MGKRSPLRADGQSRTPTPTSTYALDDALEHGKGHLAARVHEQQAGDHAHALAVAQARVVPPVGVQHLAHLRLPDAARLGEHLVARKGAVQRHIVPLVQ